MSPKSLKKEVYEKISTTEFRNKNPTFYESWESYGIKHQCFSEDALRKLNKDTNKKSIEERINYYEKNYQRKSL